ncbi:MAG: polyphosphate kinase 2 [Sulfurimonas sp.]|uniref:polyphosphate kinase 2 n=1 Tax=Sulfurimonas sp. TaxID=2022749 RepID=UPI0026061C8C|nr:polyphosphate kinase 2 [Sulfurimonas sp.]MDD5399675.1 polyphosphate kinase 2 [Sulfurimonas sp.]
MKEKREAGTDRREVDRDRRKEYKEGKVRIWVKEETLLYEKELVKLQVELLKYQNHVKEKGLKVLMLFEGRDAAGKGGTIKRITEHLNPRGARIVALAKPNEQERTEWYFQRYAEHLPSAGEIVIFDRSWYNRAMVEPVMGFCSDEEYSRFLNDAPTFEQLIIDKDTKIFKFYFSISKEEQAKRLQDRENDPLKQYKLSAIDQSAQRLWDKYTAAKYKMLKATNTKYAPWTIIKSDNKKKARINVMKHILNLVDYPNQIDSKEITVDKNIIIDAKKEVQRMEKDSL